MRENSLYKHRRNLLLGLAVASLVLLVGTSGMLFQFVEASAPQTNFKTPWTAVASTGTVDEAAAGIYAFGTTDVGYNPASNSANSLFIRYNVTNTYDNNANPNMPGWRTLELGSVAPPGSEVRATFYRVNPCDGKRQRICTTNNPGQGGPKCTTCDFPPEFGPVDFSEFLYYVEVQLLRSANPAGVPVLANPKAFTLRVY